MTATPKKILLVASHGGHWVQLRRIAPAFEGMDVHYICTTTGVRAEVAPASLSVVRDANLKEGKWGVLPLAWQMFWIVARRRPDVVLSTGAAPGFFALAFAKLFGAKTIWVDSIANAEQLSLSGAKVRRFADLWLTQWPEVEGPNGPYYRGAVL